MGDGKAENSSRTWMLGAGLAGHGDTRLQTRLRPAFADVKIGVLMPLSGKGPRTASTRRSHEDGARRLQKTGIKGGRSRLSSYDTRGEKRRAINLTRKN